MCATACSPAGRNSAGTNTVPLSIVVDSAFEKRSRDGTKDPGPNVGAKRLVIEVAKLNQVRSKTMGKMFRLGYPSTVGKLKD